MADSKVCSKCSVKKELSEFPASRPGVHGVHSHCKQCRNTQKREWRRTNNEEARRRDRARERDPRKVKAKNKVSNLRRNIKVPSPCDFTCASPLCNDYAEEFHHWSYEPEHWANVVPLCLSCHKRIHTGSLTIENIEQYAIDLEKELEND